MPPRTPFASRLPFATVHRMAGAARATAPGLPASSPATVSPPGSSRKCARMAEVSGRWVTAIPCVGFPQPPVPPPAGRAHGVVPVASRLQVSAASSLRVAGQTEDLKTLSNNNRTRRSPLGSGAMSGESHWMVTTLENRSIPHGNACVRVQRHRAKRGNSFPKSDERLSHRN